MTKVGYSEEFKAQCVASCLGRGKRSVNQVSKDLGISGATLAKWVKNSDHLKGPGKGPQLSESEQIRKLEKLVFQQRLEIDFLKKMSLYLATEDLSPFKK